MSPLGLPIELPVSYRIAVYVASRGEGHALEARMTAERIQGADRQAMFNAAFHPRSPAKCIAMLLDAEVQD